MSTNMSTSSPEPFVRLRARPRTWARNQPPLPVYDLTAHALAALFAFPSADAARAVGLSLTAFKRTCRRLGVPRWPYARKRPPAPAAPAAPVAPAAPTLTEDEVLAELLELAGKPSSEDTALSFLL